MLKSINIKSYKNLNDLSVEFPNEVSLVNGNMFSGKSSVLELVPFLFSHDNSMSSQSGFYFNAGIRFYDSDRMTTSDSIDYSLSFTDFNYDVHMIYEGGTYGSWVFKNDKSKNGFQICPELKQVKLFGYKESNRASFTRQANYVLGFDGRGTSDYISYLSFHDKNLLSSVLDSMKNIYPEVIGMSAKSNDGVISNLGCADESKVDFSESYVWFFLKNGHNFPLAEMPMAFLTSICSILNVLSELTPWLVIIDDFDFYLDEDKSVVLFETLRDAALSSGKQLILSSNKTNHLKESVDASHLVWLG